MGVAALLLLAGCGSEDTRRPMGSERGDQRMDMDMQDDSFKFGDAADPSQADRTVPIDALDTPRFEPDVVQVAPGETVTFVVRNRGEAIHEFVLGDEAYQEEHAEEMAGEGEMEEGRNEVEIDPGETKEITWTFIQPGDVMYAFHEPGHYEDGMFGTISVGG